MSCAGAHGLDHIDLKRDGRKLTVSGRVLVTAEDGGLLLLAPDGQLWSVLPEELVDERKDDKAFAPWTASRWPKRCSRTCPRDSRRIRRTIT